MAFAAGTGERSKSSLSSVPGSRTQEMILLTGGSNRHRLQYGDQINDIMVLKTTNSPTRLYSLPELRLRMGRVGHQSVILNGSVITMGGFNVEDDLSSVECIDLETQTRYDAADMINARSYFAAGAIGNRVYVCGGVQHSSLVDLCEYYDMETQKWNTFQSLNRKRGAPGGVLNSMIYAVGGDSHGTTVESYDPVTDKWTMCPSLNEDRRGHGCAVWEGQIYACGGNPGIQSCQFYDPRGERWNKCADMNQGRCDFAMAAASGKLYVAGGGDSYLKPLKTIEMYEPRNDKWTTLVDRIYPLVAASAVVI